MTTRSVQFSIRYFIIELLLGGCVVRHCELVGQSPCDPSFTRAKSRIGTLRRSMRTPIRRKRAMFGHQPAAARASAIAAPKPCQNIRALRVRPRSDHSSGTSIDVWSDWRGLQYVGIARCLFALETFQHNYALSITGTGDSEIGGLWAPAYRHSLGRQLV